MKSPPPSPSHPGVTDHRGLVLTASGSAHQVGGLMTEAGPVLAALLGLPLLELRLDCSPHTALAQLRGEPPGGGDEGWLAALGLDPGLPLEQGGSWGEALGAWRQPTLAMITGPQLDTGLPAAATALLAQWNVPLLGLIQWGGEWDPPSRRRDGLAWLGAMAVDGGRLDPEEGCGADALRLALCQRWRAVGAG